MDIYLVLFYMIFKSLTEICLLGPSSKYYTATQLLKDFRSKVIEKEEKTEENNFIRVRLSFYWTRCRWSCSTNSIVTESFCNL